MERTTPLRNALFVFPIAIAQSVIYSAISHFPLFKPQALQLTWIDDAMPFLPWTIWPYLVMMFGSAVLALFVRDRRVFRQTLRAYLAAYAVTFAIHLFWPTVIERPNVADDGTFQTWAYRLLLTADAANSCFPSGHIVGPMILCWAMWRDNRRVGVWLIALFPWLSLTILTTKQHYFWDLLGGYAVGLLAITWAAGSLRSRSELKD